MPTFHFEVGDGADGIGLCADVKSDSREAAVQHLRDFLKACSQVDLCKLSNSPPQDNNVKCVTVYIEPANIGARDITEVKPDEKEKMDPELLYYAVREFIQEQGAFIPDEVDDQLGEICRAIVEGTNNQS